MSSPAIVTSAIERRFGDLVAVAGVDLAIETGEMYGFLGPNGAGKSTLVRMLVTLLSPTAGSGSVAGYDVVVAPDEVRLRIGVALQEAALDLKATGRELLLTQAQYYGMTREEGARRITELDELVDVDALDRRVGTYSGGMRRRLDLAAALMHRPEVLFLDEPTTGLDPTSRARVWEEVRHLNQELGMTVFLTTQYLEEADALADRVGIINAGKLVAEGTPSALKRAIGSDLIVARVEGDTHGVPAALDAVADVDSVEIRGATITITTRVGAQTLSPVAVALNSCGVEVTDLTLRTPTLDDVFLELTGDRLAANDAIA